MKAKILTAAAAVVLSLGLAGPVHAAGEAIEIPHIDWSFDGPFGTFDRAAAQRGLQVYQEACSICHGLDLVAYRHLADIGYDEEQIEAIAAQRQVVDGPDENGEMFERDALPSDFFVPPYPNENAAKAANSGALPPDLSLIVKSRPGGADYVRALLTGYEEPPADFEGSASTYYNAYFPGHQIAMPQPLYEDGVTYADGTEATIEQMAYDVTTFMAWAAEPELEARKRLGVKVILFLLVLTGLLYAYKKKVWSDLH